MRYLKYLSIFLLGFLVSNLWNAYEKQKHQKEDAKIFLNGIKNMRKLVVSEGSFSEVYTFSDSSWSEGDLYEQNGFIIDKVLPPDYSYLVYNMRKHKFNFRKNESDIKDKYPKIYNCGLKKYKIHG